MEGWFWILVLLLFLYMISGRGLQGNYVEPMYGKVGDKIKVHIAFQFKDRLIEINFGYPFPFDKDEQFICNLYPSFKMTTDSYELYVTVPNVSPLSGYAIEITEVLDKPRPIPLATAFPFAVIK